MSPMKPLNFARFLVIAGLAGMFALAGPANALAGAPASPPDAKAAAPVDDVTSDVTQGALRFKNAVGTYVECPLKRTDVQAEISGFLARVKVTQTFVNSATDRIEAVYVFPLPHKSAVDSMTMKIGDRSVVGVIKRREVARQIYEQAIAQGHTAALLEQERPNIFTQSVGNIEPGGTVRIEITYVDALDYDMGVYAFHFPMVVGHRYIPGGAVSGRSGTGTAPDTDRVPDASRITPPRIPPGAERSGADISLSVQLDAGVPVQDLKSVNHKVEMKQTGRSTATCRIAGGDTIPNKDFELRYKVVGDKPEMAILAHADSGKDGYFMLMVQPREDEALKKAPPREVTFLVDVSGSMGGPPTAKVKQAMREFLQQSSPRDKIQLITFAGSAHKLFPKPVESTPENIKKVVEFAEGYEGGGGTEMLKGIKAAIEDPLDAERVRIVIMLTDGYIGNEAEIIKEVGAKCGDKIRFWCIGIGNSVNRFLVDGVAKQGGGMGKVLSLNSKPDEVKELVGEIVLRIHRAQLANIAINWGGLNVYETYPARVPELWAGRPVVVFGRYAGHGKSRVRISGEAEGQAVSFEVAAELPKSEPDNDALAVTWARQKIESLMESVAYEDSPEVIEEVTKIALEYRLMSQYTSFVAVDEKTLKDLDVVKPPRRVAVPVPVPEGVNPACFGYAGVGGPVAEEMDALSDVALGGGKGEGLRKSLALAPSMPMPTSKPSGAYAPAKEMKALERREASSGRYFRLRDGQAQNRLGAKAGEYAKAQSGAGYAAGAMAPSAPPPMMAYARGDSAGSVLMALTSSEKDLGEVAAKKLPDRETDKAAGQAGAWTGNALSEGARKRSEADGKKAKDLLAAAAKLLADGKVEAARGAYQLAWLFDESRMGGGEVGAEAQSKLEEIEAAFSAGRLAAESRLKARVDVVIRERGLAEALADVAKAAGLRLSVVPGSIEDITRLLGERSTRITYLDLRRCSAADAIDAICGPAHLDYTAGRGTLTVWSARRGAFEAPWTYDVATLAIPDAKELGDGKDWQKGVKAAGEAAEEFLAAARKALGSTRDEDCFWFAPGQLAVFGDAEAHGRMEGFVASMEKGEGPLGKKASDRAAARKGLMARADEAAADREAYAALSGASWKLLAAAAAGEADVESLTWLESAWKSTFARQLAGTSRPVTALRSAWAVTESALTLRSDRELTALARRSLGETGSAADAALESLAKNPEDGGAYLATLYAAMALRNGAELKLVGADRSSGYLEKARPLLTAAKKDSALEPVRVIARTLLAPAGEKPADVKELAGVLQKGIHGDDLLALAALAARRAGDATWLAFRSDRDRLRDGGASGPVVLLASRLNKPLLPSAR